ncbi:MAG: nucleoside diphosphate kinase regulator [Coriobacteriia bacterium]
MDSRRLIITKYDRDRLVALIHGLEGPKARQDLKTLLGELNRAQIVAPEEVPADVVTMNSKVTLVDAETSERMGVTLVFPPDADAAAGRISVLAPIGTAIIGYREGDTIEWPVPSGLRRLRIEKVDYQPEASGDMTL